MRFGSTALHSVGDPEKGIRWMDELLTKREMLAKVKLSFPTVWRKMRRGEFPAARVLGNKSMWLSSELEDYITTLPRRKYRPDAKRERPAIKRERLR